MDELTVDERLIRASEQVFQLQRDLLKRQADVLDLAIATDQTEQGRLEPLTLIDRTEDARRSLANDLASMRLHVQDAVVSAKRDLAPSLDLASAEREAFDCVGHLSSAVDALSRTSQALPSQSDLIPIARRSFADATSAIERGRRATFRLGQRLPRLRSVGATDVHPTLPPRVASVVPFPSKRRVDPPSQAPAPGA